MAAKRRAGAAMPDPLRPWERSSIPQSANGPTPLDVAAHQRAQGHLIAGAREHIRAAREARAQTQLAQNIAGRESVLPAAGSIAQQSHLRQAAVMRRQFVAQGAAGPRYGGR